MKYSRITILRTLLISMIILFIGFVLPFLGSTNCPGAGFVHDNCTIQSDFLVNYAAFYNYLLFASVYLFFVPIFLYCAVFIGTSIFLPKLIIRGN